MELLITVLTGLAFGLVVLALLSCCVQAGRSDDAMTRETKR